MRQKKSTVLLGLSVAAISNVGLLSSYSATAGEVMLEEVTVTAQKREQSLQDAVVSVTAFNEANLERLNVQNLEDISAYTPNLRISSVATDSTTASISMRGTINNNPTDPNGENTVGLYMDGVYIGKSAGALMEMSDVARMEVLRGPQGTLYGKNTIGGAINIVRNRPGEELSGKLQAGAGNEGLLYSNGFINPPAVGVVGEGLGQLRSRISFLTRARDGLFENVPTTVVPPGNPLSSTSEFNDIDRQSAGILLDWEINDSFSLGYSYDTAEINQNAALSQVTFTYKGAIPTDPFLIMEDFANPERQETGSTDYDGTYDKAEIEGHSLIADWHLGDLGALGDVDLKSITAKRTVGSSSRYDMDSTTLNAMHIARYTSYEWFSQEFQLRGSTDSLNYVTGLYYSEEDADFVGISAFEAVGKEEGVGWTDSENNSTAIYGQVDWQPAALDRLTLSLGGRYSEENKETTRYDSTGDIVNIPYQTLPKLEFSEDTYMASAAWALTDDANIYLKFSEGYRSGLYDGQTGNPDDFDVPIESEYMSSWELGFKSRWMEDRLQVNVTAFISEYEDMLVTTWDSAALTTRTQNAGESEITGVELEVMAQVSEELLLSFSYGYLQGEWLSYPVEIGTEIVDMKDIAAFAQSPESSFTAALDYNFSPFDFGQLSFHIDYSYTDAFYGTPLSYNYTHPIDEVEIPVREMINARLALSNVMIGNNSLEFVLWGKNLADKEIARSKLDVGGAVLSEWEDPLTYGAEVTLRF